MIRLYIFIIAMGNLCDVAMTYITVDLLDIAIEVNPVVNTIGLTAILISKLVLSMVLLGFSLYKGVEKFHPITKSVVLIGALVYILLTVYHIISAALYLGGYHV